MTPPVPTELFSLSVGYWNSCALFSAIELGVFVELCGERSTEDLAGRLGVPERGLRLLLEALAALGLVVQTSRGWQNAPVSQAYLVPGKEAYLGETILFNARSYPAWGELTQAVRTDQPPRPHDHFLGADSKATRNFVLAMHQRAQGVARCLVPVLPLGGVKRLLDLGGGPATYARLLTDAYPTLEVTVVDLPAVLEVAAELHGDSLDRVTLLPGDIFAASDDTGLAAREPFDAILISGVIHRTEGEQTRSFLERFVRFLAPGGLLAISDLFTGGEQQGPVLAELFSLHMLVTANCGRSLPEADVRRTMGDLGFADIAVRSLPPPLPHKVITGCLAACT